MNKTIKKQASKKAINQNSNKHKPNKYRTLNIICGCLFIVMSGALAYCGINMKNEEEKEYLALEEHLLNRHIEMMYGREDRACGLESYGLSQDHEVAARFWCQDYSVDTHEPVGDKYYRTLYFQHPKVYEWGYSGYAEALGD